MRILLEKLSRPRLRVDGRTDKIGQMIPLDIRKKKQDCAMRQLDNNLINLCV